LQILVLGEKISHPLYGSNFMKLDALDRRILDAVQAKADRPLHQLAEIVGSTPATCQRRLARLRTDGYIQSVISIVDQARSNEPITVLIGVSINNQSAASQRRTQKFFITHANVRMAWMTTGDFDYMLVCAFRDNRALAVFLEDDLVKLEKEIRFRTFFSLKELKISSFRSFF